MNNKILTGIDKQENFSEVKDGVLIVKEGGITLAMRLSEPDSTVAKPLDDLLVHSAPTAFEQPFSVEERKIMLHKHFGIENMIEVLDATRLREDTNTWDFGRCHMPINFREDRNLFSITNIDLKGTRPPQGRSDSQHSFILSLNKKGRK